MAARSRILVIDDEVGIRDSLRMTLEYHGYEFVGAATGQEGLALAEREVPDVVLLDIKMPGMDGMDVLTRLRAMYDTYVAAGGRGEYILLPAFGQDGHRIFHAAAARTLWLPALEKFLAPLTK